MSERKDLTNKKFGRLKALNLCNYRNKYGRAMWHCICDCGKEIDVSSNSLLKGNTKSCGCYKLDLISNRNKTHAESKTKLYQIWVSMRKRCVNKNDKAYQNYGARGIRVCDEWKNSFENFRNWCLENGYKQGLSIDRIDNNGNYCPENCRWTTRYYQSRNTRGNHIIEYNGKQYIMRDLANLLGIKYSTLAARLLVYGWTVEDAINKKVRKKD